MFGSFVRPPATPPDLLIHHYLFRSREDYARKAARGFATATGLREQARRAERTEAEFGRHNDIPEAVPEPAREATATRLRLLGFPRDVRESTVPPS